MQRQAIKWILRHNRSRDSDFTCRGDGHGKSSKAPGSMGGASAPKYASKYRNKNVPKQQLLLIPQIFDKAKQSTDDVTREQSDSTSTGLPGIGAFYPQQPPTALSHRTPTTVAWVTFR